MTRADRYKPRRRTTYISISICFLLVLQWARSFRYVDWTYVSLGNTWVGIISGGGRICIFKADDPRFTASGSSHMVLRTAWLYPWPELSGLSNTSSMFESLGFVKHDFGIPDVYIKNNDGSGMAQLAFVFGRCVYVPYYSLVWLFLSLVGIQYWRFLRRERNIAADVEYYQSLRQERDTPN